jgi:hypothetical protein
MCRSVAGIIRSALTHWHSPDRLYVGKGFGVPAGTERKIVLYLMNDAVVLFYAVQTCIAVLSTQL